ncbi:MAG: diguanylate cyclase [Thiomicrorhabdus sp.]|nr:MAG: diguanylate cyclase [Thiomicrorhabdus sp.]
MISIKRFILIAISLIIIIFYLVFSYFFLADQQQKTDLIVENIRQDLSESAFIIASEVDSIEAFQSFKSFLSRKVANTPLISAMVITYRNKVLVTTDTAILQLPPEKMIISKFRKISTQELINNKVFETKSRFYIQDQVNHFSLIVYLDHSYIDQYYYKNSLDFFLFFGLTPLILLILLWLALKRIIIVPLELIRQYAYYQSEVPQRFRLRELEYVRSSMVQTFARLEHEKKELYRLARTDDLSGLANRHQLNERLNWLIFESARLESEFALLFIDLDNFKRVNDSLGHEIGDELLKNVSGLIQDVLRQYDIIARVGGDEFVIVLSHYQNTLELTHIIQRILDRISALHIVQTHPVRVSASIGVAFYAKDGHDTMTLLKNADIAMYEAKKSGKNQYKFFTQALQQQVIAEIELEHDLRSALKNNEFQLYYQPKININSGLVIGAEALIRWNHPTKGLISPNDFIPTAEKTRIMIELGQWVLKEAALQQVEWKKRGINDLKISVNLSAIQLLDEKFDHQFEDLLERTGICPSKFEIEMTESVFMENSQQSLNSLSKIRDHKVTISLDDFGTGYSSLAYLKKLPINTLKIDKTFMDDYASSSGAIFIETIVKIAQTLNLKVIAEGVELQAQLDYLKQVGCDEYQGYFGSRPIPADQFSVFLKKFNAQ